MVMIVINGLVSAKMNFRLKKLHTCMPNQIIKLQLTAFYFITCTMVLANNGIAQTMLFPSGISKKVTQASPLDQLIITNAKGNVVVVIDGNGNEYFRSAIKPIIPFTVGGALGKHSVLSIDQNNQKKVILEFDVNATTSVDDGGYYKNMFHLFYRGMFADADAKDGTYPVTWNEKTYRVIVPWVLDNFHTLKGLQYFLPNGKELIDIMRQSQREDGMIYSFIQYMPNADYWLTRDKYSGYSKKIGDKVFVRQPTENHPEYIYVNTIHACWKSDGDDEWMKKNLKSASLALDYCLKDPSRWSKRFGLLKRVYTIDSWDFAVEDEYMPDIGITNSMIIDPVKSKFGVFFGDNTGYITACYQLSEMFQFANAAANAAAWKKRGDEVKERLDKLAWNGKFFTHFIDEDPTVIRKLGVDEKSQLAQSNAYSLNRNISASQSKAIIKTYMDLKNNLPVGSPGEWYAIYPPFQKGFGTHGDIWQYMNGGVGGHVAGELALGAYNNGYEKYGTDILNRLFELGKKYDNKIWFAYTGSIPSSPPPSPVYRSLDLSAFANMDITNTANGQAIPWMMSKRTGDDLHTLSFGKQTLASINFQIIDPSQNNRKAVLAISRQKGFPASAEIPVNDTAGCIYLLHTSAKAASENIVGHVKINYEDGSNKLQYLVMEKHLTYWWFSQLKTDYSGIAWYGKNDVSEGVGLSWCALNNPSPNKKIKSITFEAPEGDGIYTLFALTLADKPHYIPVKPTSFGGPDNWAAATAMTAMVEGLAGIKNAQGSQAYTSAVVSPKWTTTPADSISVCIRYAASNAYTAYKFYHYKTKKQIELYITGSGKKTKVHLLLPDGALQAKTVTMNGKPILFTNSRQEEGASYVDFDNDPLLPGRIIISYK
jgi:hypothetical protein